MSDGIEKDGEKFEGLKNEIVEELIIKKNEINTRKEKKELKVAEVIESFTEQVVLLLRQKIKTRIDEKYDGLLDEVFIILVGPKNEKLPSIFYDMFDENYDGPYIERAAREKAWDYLKNILTICLSLKIEEEEDENKINKHFKISLISDVYKQYL